MKNKSAEQIAAAVQAPVVTARGRLARLVTGFLLAALVGFGPACQPNQEILKSSPTPDPRPAATLEPRRTSLEQDIKDMQTAGFDYIYVFRRKDGGAFDKDDRRYLRENSPPETNRFVLTDDERAFVAGSGFRFSPENMEALRKRFDVADHSKPEAKQETKDLKKQETDNQNKPANR